MKKKVFLAAAVAFALTAASCGGTIQPLDPLNPIDREPSAPITVSSVSTSAPETTAAPESTSEPGTEAPGTEPEETETAPASETEAPVTEAPPETTPEPVVTEKPVEMNPVAVDQSVIDASPVWFSNITTVGNNPEFKECVEALNKLVADYGYRVGFAYQNMVTGVSIRYNATKRFPSCSTIKVPYCKSIIDNGINLDDPIKIVKAWYDAEPEPGHLTGADIGKTYTARELIANAVSLSDNTAYINLVEKYGRYVFNLYTQNLGASYALSGGYYFTPVSPADLLLSYKDIYELGERTETGKWLCELMQHSSFNKQIGAALGDKYPVSHKYGTDCETNSYHDVAICYAEQPFVLVIMTDQVPETDAANKMFQDTARIFDRLNSVIIG
ncbi:MAG: serine hydrolase [Ruminococcus sp.]|nr:serine hydrolase [Ruminococcus sp.]